MRLFWINKLWNQAAACIEHVTVVTLQFVILLAVTNVVTNVTPQNFVVWAVTLEHTD